MTVIYPGRYPEAEWRPLGEQTQPRMIAHDIICLHTMVGTLAGTDAMFHDHGYGGTESHFGLGGFGELVQWQDLRHSADANLDGSRRIISIETADSGDPFAPWSGSDVPAWTDQQLAVLATLIAWLADHYRIPLALIPDSRPGRRGVGWHRQGIDPWRVAGGERWSTKPGKVCPGDRRISQLPELIDEARRISAATAAGRGAMSRELERDLRAMWAGMAPGGLAALERDLRGDLAVKAEQLTRIEQRQDQIEAKVDQVLEHLVTIGAAGAPVLEQLLAAVAAAGEQRQDPKS